MNKVEKVRFIPLNPISAIVQEAITDFNLVYSNRYNNIDKNQNYLNPPTTFPPPTTSPPA